MMDCRDSGNLLSKIIMKRSHNIANLYTGKRRIKYTVRYTAFFKKQRKADINKKQELLEF